MKSGCPEPKQFLGRGERGERRIHKERAGWSMGGRGSAQIKRCLSVLGFYRRETGRRRRRKQLRGLRGGRQVAGRRNRGSTCDLHVDCKSLQAPVAPTGAAWRPPRVIHCSTIDQEPIVISPHDHGTLHAKKQRVPASGRCDSPPTLSFFWTMSHNRVVHNSERVTALSRLLPFRRPGGHQGVQMEFALLRRCPGRVGHLLVQIWLRNDPTLSIHLICRLPICCTVFPIINETQLSGRIRRSRWMHKVSLVRY